MSEVAVARQRTYSAEAVARVRQAIEIIYEGVPLKVALEQLGMNRKMFTTVIAGERELGLLYARAREVSADFLVDEALEIVRNEPDVMRAREIANMNRWAAGKFNSKRYGDRIDLNITQQLDISSTLYEAKSRITRSVSDQLVFEEAQVLDYKGTIEHKPTDNKSDSLAEPDIFRARAPDSTSVSGAGADEDEVDIFS